MNPPPEPQPRQRRYSTRHQARLDAETHAKLEQLASTFHRKRSATLRYVMQWAISQSCGWAIDQSPVVAVPPVPVLLEPELLQRVQDAAAVHGATVAAWIRHAMRQVSRADFPPSWHPEAAQDDRPRSHDSRDYGQRFMLRLDETTAQKLQQLVERFARPRAEIIRQLVAQATPEDFPEHWQLAAEENRIRRAPPRNSQRSTPIGLRRSQTWRKSDA
jgi:predicted transcriptional regulator